MELDALLVSDQLNCRYLSGFSGSSGMLLITQAKALIATDFRYYEQAEAEAPAFELVPLGMEREHIVQNLLERVTVHRVGFESKALTVWQYQRLLKPHDEVEWVETNDLVESLRAVKDAEEIAAIGKAAAIADEAFGAAMNQVKSGMTERELAWILEREMRERKADRVAFEIIVASAGNSARPHARPTDTPLPSGQAIIIDMGAQVDGYNSDMTRTICLGEPEDTCFWQVYEAVREAQQRALMAIRPNVPAREIDAVARNVLQELGYGDAFGHGLGHGVGLSVHEKPRLHPHSEDVLEAGMIVTVEPGVYLSGWGGVRIEDLVVIGETGIRLLTQTSREPLVPSA